MPTKEEYENNWSLAGRIMWAGIGALSQASYVASCMQKTAS